MDPVLLLINYGSGKQSGIADSFLPIVLDRPGKQAVEGSGYTRARVPQGERPAAVAPPPIMTSSYTRTRGSCALE